MKKLMKSTLTLLLAIVFMATLIIPAKAETLPPQINYVALGDSVAAGVIYGTDSWPDGKSELGYTNDLKVKLEDVGFTVNFNNDFCQAGMTAAMLAQQSAALNYPVSSQYALVHNAQLVTLDVGINDLLGPFYAYVSANPAIYNINLTSPTTQDLVLINGLKDVLNKIVNDLYFGSTGKTAQMNIETTLQNILNANPKAQIYVMGYYNAMPLLSKYGLDLTLPTAYFNTFIYKAVNDVRAKNRGSSISYVETLLPMADGVNRGLLYPLDIHPTAKGYSVIADQFWQRIRLNYLVSRFVNTKVH